MNRRPRFALHCLALAGLLTLAGLAVAQDTTGQKKWPTPKDPNDFHMILWDSDEIPPWFPQDNPHMRLASMNSWTTPVMDHTGKPHAHGHVVQILEDGGNGVQDPPNPDGTPGGDDSLAYGNMNMIRLMGIEVPPDPKAATGMFFSQRYFIPYKGDRAYFLRLWEGDDIATAPYYQDTVEYNYGADRGGAMIRLPEGPPVDIDWKFGPSKPRAKP